MAYKSLNDLILVLLCNLIFYRIHSHSFFSCLIAFIRFLKHPRGFWIHENVPRLVPQDLILYFPPSPVMLEMVEHISILMGFCLLCPTPNHAIADWTRFLSECFHTFTSESIYLDSCPDSESPGSPRHLSCPATHGWFYSDWEANQM